MAGFITPFLPLLHSSLRVSSLFLKWPLYFLMFSFELSLLFVHVLSLSNWLLYLLIKVFVPRPWGFQKAYKYKIFYIFIGLYSKVADKEICTALLLFSPIRHHTHIHTHTEFSDVPHSTPLSHYVA